MRPFDAAGRFQAATMPRGILRLAVRGAGVTVGSSMLGLAIQVVATVSLARLLTPKDFGLVAMVTTFSLILMNFGLNGFTEAILQKEELSHSLVSNLFWINVSSGLLLTIGFASAGRIIARVFDDYRVTGIAAAMSLTIAIASISVQHLALLKRAMQFSALAANDITAKLLAVTASIFLAWAGWHYWALVIGAIVLALSTSIGAWVLCRWTPGCPRRVPGTAEMVRFALNTYGHFGLNYLSRNIDNALVGWRFGAESLGFYKKAYDLFALSSSQMASPLTAVAVSALSRLNQDLPRYRRYVLKMLSTIAFVSMGISGALTLTGSDLIRLLLGPGWDTAGEIFTFFGPGIGVMLLYGAHGWISLSIGRADRWLRWGAAELAVTVALFCGGLRWGSSGVALAWTLSYCVLTIPALGYAGGPINLRIVAVLDAVWKYLVAFLLAGASSLFIIWQLPPLVGPSTLNTLARILLISGLFEVLYVGAVISLHRSFFPVKELVALLREMVYGRASAAREAGSTIPAISKGTLASVGRAELG